MTIERVAIKVIDKTKMDGKITKMLLREITMMDACYHPHLVRLYEVVETNNKIHLIMQLAPGGELFTKLIENGMQAISLTLDIMRDYHVPCRQVI